ncbi:sn-glycerol-1-phosphate dehydrogenase [Absicoccus porci]|jgi:glycerol-1-phosphate dehydrogenase [NAD(P)+]|uniref:sn-glycerol-1-phosphate dehydrogenase n=2 Tax=Absicoccus porci TaxID=2486576 RepID=A0A3N0I062_9FIRM|nr:sn-glycerol-1-phosphate dehydrogenase [Absicoccus porci]
MIMSNAPKLADYLGKPFKCSCGRTHSTGLEGCTVGAGVLTSLVDYVEKYGFKKVYVACDEITYGIAGEKVMNILHDANIDAKAHVFTGGRFIPNEESLGKLMIDAPRDLDLVVAVGTGSINDMCRFFSYQMNVPYAIVATAAPMDGFASSGAALMVDNIKQTIPAQTPLFIIGDTDILCGAPARMISAGLGDLLGKFTCLNDWRISKIINDEYYCDTVVNLVKDCIENVLTNADKAASRDPKVIGDIMEGLVLTGVAMSFVGNSRPAAGCEHHLNHYWEAIEIQNGQIPVLHGIEVGLAEVVILKMTEFLRESRPDFDAARAKAKQYDQAAWEAKMKEVYGTASDAIIELEHESKKNEPEGRLKRIDKIEENWDEIVKLMNDYMPTSDRMIEILKSLDAPYFPSQVGFSDEMLYNALVYGKENRARYTMLSMMGDLGVLEDLANKVVAFVNE